MVAPYLVLYRRRILPRGFMERGDENYPSFRDLANGLSAITSPGSRSYLQMLIGFYHFCPWSFLFAIPVTRLTALRGEDKYIVSCMTSAKMRIPAGQCV